MTVFWIVTAMFLLGALLFLLPSLLAPAAGSSSVLGVNMAVHRDQLREAENDLAAGLITPERLAQARSEIERRVLEDSVTAEVSAPQPAKRTAWALGVLIPLASVLTYLQLGAPEAAAPQIAAAKPEGGRHSITPEQIQQMVTALAERLKAQPDDREGWLMLARSYTSLGRYRDAVTALRRAKDLGPPDASLLAGLADVARSVSFKLDDSMAMQAQLRLSAFAQIVIGARISKSGQCDAAAGEPGGAEPDRGARCQRPAHHD